RAATRRTSGVADLVHDRQLPLGIEDNTVAHAVIDAEHHQQTGALIGQAHTFVLDAVADQFTGLVDGQHVTFLEVVACALVQDDYIILTDLGDTVGYIQNQALDLTFRIAGEEGGGHGALLGLQQAVTDANFLTAAVDHESGDVALGCQDLDVADLLGMQAEELAGLRIGIGLATAVEAVGR